MRILYVTFRESLQGGASGGVIETQVRDLLVRLRAGATIRWMALTGREARGSEDAGQPSWISQVNIDRVPWWPSRVRALSDLTREFRRFQPDVIHARGYNATLLVMIASRGRIPVIFDARSLMALERVAYGRASATSGRTRVWGILEGWMIRSAAAVVGVSPPMSDYFRRRARHRLVETIPLAVDIERMSSALIERDSRRHKLGLIDDAPLVVYSGSLSLGMNGLDVLARVMQGIHRGTPTVQFLCLTRDDPGPLIAALEGVGRIPMKVLAASYEDMPGWLAAADWGLVVRSPLNPRLVNESVLTTKFPEYLASGLPVIVNETSTWLMHLVRDERLGLVVSGSEVTPIVLRVWAARERDRLRLFAAANYALERVAGSYLALYRRVSSPWGEPIIAPRVD